MITLPKVWSISTYTNYVCGCIGIFAFLVALATHEAQPQRSFLWWPQCVDRFYNAGASWMGVNFWYRREMATFQWLADLGSQINFVYLVEFMSSLGLYGQETLRLMAS